MRRPDYNQAELHKPTLSVGRPGFDTSSVLAMSASQSTPTQRDTDVQTAPLNTTASISAPGTVCMCTQSCLTLRDPMDCSLPGSSAHGIFQARILEWVAISSSRGCSHPRDQTCISCVSCIGRQVLYHKRHLGSPRCSANSYLLGERLGSLERNLPTESTYFTPAPEYHKFRKGHLCSTELAAKLQDS